MAGFDDLGEGVRKIFLAGVGAVAMGAEKSQELVDELVKKGELTVEQGKTVNEELKRKVQDVTSGTSDVMLKAKLKGMSPEERAAWVEGAQKLVADLDSEATEKKAEEASEDEPTAE